MEFKNAPSEVNIEEGLRQQEYIIKLKQLIAEKTHQMGRRPTCCVTTFGCQMNAKDSEKLTGILKEAGYEIIESEDADFVIFNTCTVRDNANQRVYGRLGQLGHQKKKNPDMKIALCGCMMQEAAVIEKIKKSYRHVNLIFGTHNIFKFAELLYRMLTTDKMVIDIWESTDKIVETLPIERKYPFKCGINIMFGCNNFCSYCIVPYVRGRERSREMAEILDEIKRLAADGVKEVMLLGQNVNSYGKNCSHNVNFPKLLRMINDLPGDFKIRFMTSHPKDCTKELLDTMASCEKVARHLHLPFQSGNNRVLKEMNRGYTREDYIGLIEYARSVMPDISVTSDIIVGFPGETRGEFEDTLSLIKEVRFTSLFTFIFSPREGTRAKNMEDNVPYSEKSRWFTELLKLQETIAAERCKSMLGKTYEVLVESETKEKDGRLTGRTDGNINIDFEGDISLIGQYKKVRVTNALNWILSGELE